MSIQHNNLPRYKNETYSAKRKTMTGLSLTKYAGSSIAAAVKCYLHGDEVFERHRLQDTPRHSRQSYDVEIATRPDGCTAYRHRESRICKALETGVVKA